MCDSTRLLRGLAVLVLALACITSVDAEACSWDAGFLAEGTGWEWTTAADGPLIVDVTRYSQVVPDPDPWDPDELDVVVTDATGAEIDGETKIEESRYGQRLVWTPDAPLASSEYDIEIRAVGAPGAATGTVTVVALDDLPDPVVTQPRISEQQLEAGEKTCCDSGSHCYSDSCYPEDVCESCWYERYEYPAHASAQTELPTGLPSNWVERRMYRVEPDGTDVLAEYAFQAEFAEDAPWPRCVIAALYDHVRDIETREDVCFDEAELVTVERQTLDNTYAKSLCVDAPDGGSDEKSSGGCATADGLPSSLWVLVGLLVVRRRRQSFGA